MKRGTYRQDFMVVDCETTGLDTDRDRILSIAAIPVRNGEIQLEDSGHWMVNQEAVSASSSEIHGLISDDIRDGLPEAQVMAELEKMGRGMVWVGHHIGFDIAIIGKAWYRCLGRSLKVSSLDTARIYHRLEFPEEPFRALPLEEVAGKMNVPVSGRHTAEGDALTTAMLFIKLLRRASDKGITHWKDLRKRGGNPFFRW